MNDDTTRVQPIPFSRDPAPFERRLLFALFVAYLGAGAVLAFACLELASVADTLNSAPICRRL